MTSEPLPPIGGGSFSDQAEAENWLAERRDDDRRETQSGIREPLDTDAPELAVVAGLGRLSIADCSDEEVRLARLLHEPWADETLEAMMPTDRSIVLKQARMALAYARRDSAAGDSITARPGADDRTPEQVARDNTEASGRWPDGWGPFHRHFASDEIHRDADCDNPVARRRVWVFDTGHLDEHERHIAEREHVAAQSVVEQVRTLCNSADDYFHLNESPAIAVRAVPVTDLRAAIGEGPKRRVHTDPDIDLEPGQNFGHWWRWTCHDCGIGVGTSFLTEGRAEESVETHLRTRHREAWLKAREQR